MLEPTFFKKNKKGCLLLLKAYTMLSPRYLWFFGFFMTSEDFLVSKNGLFLMILVIFGPIFQSFQKHNFGNIYQKTTNKRSF